MLQKLGNIAEIQFGSYDKPQEKGSVKYLHAGHFDKLYKPTKFEKSFIELDGKNDKFLLQPNDVILAGKGHRTFAWAYNELIGAGATITSIPKKELEEITVVIPSIKEQQRMVDFIDLLDEDLRLTQDLLKKRTALKKGLINRMMYNQIKMKT